MSGELAYGGGCGELLTAAGLPVVACCSSCHIEEEDGYESGVIEEFNGQSYHVCCTVAGAFDRATPTPGAQG